MTMVAIAIATPLPALGQDQPSEQAVDYNGVWVGEDYECGRFGISEDVQFVQDGETITATKITGDACVPAGNLTFRGTIGGPATCVVGTASNPASDTVSGTIQRRSADVIVACDITFTRKSSLAKTASKDGKCDWEIYYKYIRDNGPKIIEAFDKDTLKLVEQDNDRVTDKKLYPYSQNVRASFVSYDQNAALVKYEKLVNEMIANQGADDWLKKARREIVLGFINANREYWQSAEAKQDCPGYVDQKGQRELLLPLATGHAVAERYRSGNLDEDLKYALKMQQDFTERFFRGAANSELVSAAIQRKAENLLWDQVGLSPALQDRSTQIAQELREARARLERKKAEGIEITPELLRRETDYALRRATVGSEGAKTNAEGTKQAAVDASKWFASALASYAVSPELFPKLAAELNSGSYVLSFVDHANIVNAIFNLGTIANLKDQALPTLNATREDVAHLEVLLRRYDLFHKRYLKFGEDYRKMFVQAKAAASKN